MTLAGGSSNIVTLKVFDGVARQTFIKARTNNSTAFSVHIDDDGGRQIMTYGIHKGELNDIQNHYPMEGENKLFITNVSATETFDVKWVVEEKK